MLIKKVIKAKIIEANKGKLAVLDREYANFQKAMRGYDVELYSATKQQAERLMQKIKKQNSKGGKSKNYPLILRNDVYDVRVTDDVLTKYWMKIPIYGVRSGLKLPIRPHCEIETNCKFREAKLFKHNGEWFIHITVEKEVELKETTNALAIDLGIRRIATVISSVYKRPEFYGKELRKVRGHFFHIRRKLGKQKKFKAIKKIGRKERRLVDDQLHKISRAIVNRAKEENSAIILGDLKGIRKKNNRGRTFNRKLNSFPYHRLLKFIEYKANWEGIPVIKISEAYTSKTCSLCGERGSRYRGRFVCEKCEIKLNADYNGALNILKRGLGYISNSGAGLT